MPTLTPTTRMPMRRPASPYRILGLPDPGQAPGAAPRPPAGGAAPQTYNYSPTPGVPPPRPSPFADTPLGRAANAAAQRTQDPVAAWRAANPAGAAQTRRPASPFPTLNRRPGAAPTTPFPGMERVSLPDAPPGGVDPLPSEAVSAGQVNQIANSSANVAATGAADRIRQLQDMFGASGATGSLATMSDEILNDASLQAQGARTSAELDAANQNSQYRLGRADRQLGERQQNLGYLRDSADVETRQRGQDIDYTLGAGRLGTDRDVSMGRLALDTELGRADLGLRERSDLRDYDLGRRGIDTTRRGQDFDFTSESGRQRLGARGQDLSWLEAQLGASMTGRGQDVQRELADLDARGRARSDDLRYGSENRGRELDWLQALLDAGLTARGQDVGYASDRDRNTLGARGQDIDIMQLLGQLGDRDADRGVTQRGQDIDFGRTVYGSRADREEAERNRRMQLVLEALRGG